MKKMAIRRHVSLFTRLIQWLKGDPADKALIHINRELLKDECWTVEDIWKI